MNITINGSSHDLPSSVRTLSSLLTHLDLKPQGRIIELNDTIYTEDHFKTTQINPNDHVEIIQFMGGGS